MDNESLCKSKQGSFNSLRKLFCQPFFTIVTLPCPACACFDSLPVRRAGAQQPPGKELLYKAVRDRDSVPP